MKHVLITGGSGFIGSHLCEAFLAKGYAVTAVDNLLTGRHENIAHLEARSDFQFFKWDICQAIPEEKLTLLKAHGLAGVMHFACPASPIDFDRIPFEILHVDSIGTMHTVALARKHGARLILASTSEVYGDPEVHPQKEEYWGNVNSIGPRACYDETKRFAEAYVSTAMRAKDRPLNAAIVRIFNTYGPRMRPDDGRIVPELCMQGLRGEPLTVHGEGQQTRSFCFVTDEVDGFMRLFESDVREVVNIGNPSEYTVLQFAEAVVKLTGGRSKIQCIPSPREDDPRRRCPDITRARTKLGWSPRVSLQEGLAQCLEYFKQYV